MEKKARQYKEVGRTLISPGGTIMSKLNRSVERSMKIIEVVSGSGVTSLAFLADQTGLPKPTVLRICATLVNQNWLTRSRIDGRYRIGPRFPRLTATADSVDAIITAGTDEIVALSNATGLGVDLAVTIGLGRVEIIDTTRRFAQHGIYPDTIGYRPSPFRSALGSAFLAAVNPEKRATYISKLVASSRGKDHKAALTFPERLREIKAKGFAAREEEYWGRAVDYGGVPNAISVAIKSGDQPVGSISLVWLAEQRNVASVANEHLEKLNKTAQAIGASLILPEGEIE
ncbi:helix-turn-helix domain-containing protein [Sulfitobacter sp. F26169L]|uniref:IclR family transcriptional regulator n=1 Tax=Sulfitobacter sp. F26169L TaxID=2996015 RepID=UPI002260EAB6|nr:helix-turn-helix domain-containing protein [Sulfitobacter sp. F26169L]MCX7565008.1 helix-turn-helix domain-containing protein [Sulfitobacter sp. F26169L]